MQQTSLSLSEGDSSVLINTYYAPQIYNNVLMSTWTNRNNSFHYVQENAVPHPSDQWPVTLVFCYLECLLLYIKLLAR